MGSPKKKRKRSGSSEESGSKSDDPDSETQFKKKQRKSGVLKEFNDGEIRRFVKSYKKFPLPLTRMEDIGCDAELRDKGTASLLELGRHLHERCVEALGGEDASAMIERPESIKLGNVSVNPKTLLEIEALLNPLGKLMPEDAEERKCWAVTATTFKDAHFDVSWSLEEDSKLLVGIYEHGLGSWEQVKSDKVLELGDKILLNASCKPQAKHLDTRAAYLLRMLARVSKEETKEKRKKKSKKAVKEKTEEKEKEYKTPAIVEDDDSSNDEAETKKKRKKEKKRRRRRQRHLRARSTLDPARSFSSLNWNR